MRFFLVLKGNKTVAQQVPLSKLQVNQFLLSFDSLKHFYFRKSILRVKFTTQV